MEKITTKEEQKKWILQNWKHSDGKRISEMLKHYFKANNIHKEDELLETAKLIFLE